MCTFNVACCINATWPAICSHCLAFSVGAPCVTVIYHSLYHIRPPYQTSDSAVFSAVRNVAVITPLTHHMYLAR